MRNRIQTAIGRTHSPPHTTLIQKKYDKHSFLMKLSVEHESWCTHNLVLLIHYHLVHILHRFSKFNQSINQSINQIVDSINIWSTFYTGLVDLINQLTSSEFYTSLVDQINQSTWSIFYTDLVYSINQ